MSGSILWLTPDKPDSISVGRTRVASHLRSTGFDVDIRATTRHTIVESLFGGNDFTAVIGTTRLGAIAGILISRTHGIPLIVDHIDPIEQLRATENEAIVRVTRRMEHLAFRLAAHVLYVYPEEKSRIAGRATKLSRTNLGVEYDRFANPDPAVVDQAERQMDELNRKVAVYIGGLEPIYNIEPLLAAAKELENWTLLIIGTGSLESDVEEVSRESDTVRYLGQVPHEQIPGYLNCATVGVSLVDDPYTLKLLEYGAAGLDVVQLEGQAESRYGGLVEYCTIEPENIASAIRRCRQTDRGSALQTYVKQYDWKQIAEAYAGPITNQK